MRILLVEDDRFAAKSAGIIIKIACPEAALDVAVDGNSALACVDSNTYDLIFMDYGLPDMHGTDVTTNMREKGVESTILALSGNFGTVTKEKMQAAGLNGGFSKPLTKEKLKEALNICDNNKRA